MLGSQIREMRKSMRLTEVDLADELGVKKQTVCNWENENIAPSVEMLRRIALYFSCSVDHLLEMDTERIIVDAAGLTPVQRAHIQALIDDLRKSNGLQQHSAGKPKAAKTTTKTKKIVDKEE